MPVIPKEQIEAFQRWEINAFDRPPTPLGENAAELQTTPQPPASASDSAGELVANFKMPTAEEIERVHADAQQQGYQAGFDNGRQEGYAAGQAAAQAEAELIVTLHANFAQALERLDQQVAEQLLELALEIARQVVRSTLTAEPERVLPVIREAIAALPLHHGSIALHLNPADAELLHKLLGNQIGQSGWHLIEDATVARGGALLRAGASEVDASLETRWRRVIESLGDRHDPAA